MPLYEFENLETQEEQSFFFSFENAPSLGSVVEIEGEQWKRVITAAPYGVVKGSDNPMSPHAFVEKTGNKKGTIGDLLDESKELSEKRKKIYGRDPVQEKFFDDWSKKRGGRPHPSDNRPKKPEKLKVKQ